MMLRQFRLPWVTLLGGTQVARFFWQISVCTFVPFDWQWQWSNLTR